MASRNELAEIVDDLITGFRIRQRPCRAFSRGPPPVDQSRQCTAAGFRPAYTLLPFKLHQFISQTGSVYTTLDQDDNRFITLEPGMYKEDEAEKKPIFPNVFSRASGHPFICVSRVGDRLEPGSFGKHSRKTKRPPTAI